MTWLRETPAGWAEPRPPQCRCGSGRAIVGWVSCLCGGGPIEGGHRTWECAACGARLAIGCVGAMPAGSMYGDRA